MYISYLIFVEKWKKMNCFARILTNWYDEHKRDLPWRHTRNPYLIWISEIILQQTRVAQGYEYYQRFVHRFPDVFALAEADEDEVLKYWQGLGYYSRARNLHAAAKSMAEAGGFPTTYEGVLSLKGVGEYTAAAICSFAYDMPYAVVDGNVYRVLSRWLGIDLPIDTTVGKKAFAEAAGEMLDKSRPALYNQAVMEFGALQCVPSSPDCTACPLASGCAALQQGRVHLLPVKSHKTKVTNRYFNYIYVRMGDSTLLHKRSGNDIWKNMYEPLLVETEGDVSEDEHSLFKKLDELFGKTSVSSWQSDAFDGAKRHFVTLKRRGVKHVLSHRIIHANFYEMIVPEECALPEGYFKVDVKELQKYAVPNLVSQFFSLFLNPNNING